MVYNIALFLHIIGAIGIFSAVSVTTVCRVRMRHAQTVAQVRLLADLVGAIGNAIPLFAVTLVIPAAYMVLTAWSLGDPWILAGLSVSVLLALLVSVVFLMTAKPDVVGTLATLGVVVILALLSVVPPHRPSHVPQLASRSGGMQ